MQLIKKELSEYAGLYTANKFIESVYQFVDDRQEAGFVFFESWGISGNYGFHTFIFPSRRKFVNGVTLLKMIEYLLFEGRGSKRIFTLADNRILPILEKRFGYKRVNEYRGYMLVKKDGGICRSLYQ